jgi:hypothetical protein
MPGALERIKARGLWGGKAVEKKLKIVLARFGQLYTLSEKMRCIDVFGERSGGGIGLTGTTVLIPRETPQPRCSPETSRGAENETAYKQQSNKHHSERTTLIEKILPD